jgi:hypothetical protein
MKPSRNLPVRPDLDQLKQQLGTAADLRGEPRPQRNDPHGYSTKE